MSNTIKIDKLYDIIHDMKDNIDNCEFSKQELLEFQRCLDVLEEHVKTMIIEQSLLDNEQLNKDINDAINKLKNKQEINSQNTKEKDIEIPDILTKSKEERDLERKEKIKEREVKELEELLQKSGNVENFIKAICKEELKSDEKYQQLVDRCVTCFKRNGYIQTMDGKPLFSIKENSGLDFDENESTKKILSNGGTKFTAVYENKPKTVSFHGYEPNYELIDKYGELVIDPQLLRELYEYTLVTDEVASEQSELLDIQSKLGDMKYVKENYRESKFLEVDTDIQKLISETAEYINLNKQDENIPAKDNKFIRIFNNIFRKKQIEKENNNKNVQKKYQKNKIDTIMKNIQQNREESPINYELIYTMYYTLAKVSTEDKEEKGYGLFEKLDKNAFIKSLGENEFDEKTLDLMYTLSCSDKIESTDIQKYIEDNIQSLKKDMTQQQLKVAKVMGKKNDKWSELSNRTKDIVRQGIYSGKDIKNIFKTKEKIQEKEKYFDVEQTYGIDGINECTALIILNILENCKNNREITQETLQQLIEQGDITKDQSQEWQETAEQISRIWQGKLKNIDSER